jgi:hypothetical protein
MKRYKLDLSKLKAKIPERPAPSQEDELTLRARRIHAFMTVQARERGWTYEGTVEEIEEYIRRLAAMSVEERIEDYRRTHGREPTPEDIEWWREMKGESP